MNLSRKQSEYYNYNNIFYRLNSFPKTDKGAIFMHNR